MDSMAQSLLKINNNIAFLATGLVGATPGVAGTPSASVQSVQGFGYRSSNTFTRPSDTTAYTAGDAIGDTGGSAILTLANIGPAGGHVFITDVSLEIDVAAIPAGMTTFRLHLYDASPAAIADNAVWDLAGGDRALYHGYVDLQTPLDLGSTLYSQNTGINKKIKLATGVTSLFAILQTIGGYTPTSAAVKVLKVHSLGI